MVCAEETAANFKGLADGKDDEFAEAVEAYIEVCSCEKVRFAPIRRWGAGVGVSIVPSWRAPVTHTLLLVPTRVRVNHHPLLR